MSLTNLELIDFARSKLKTPYVYGCKGEVLTLDKYNLLKKLYGTMVWDSDKSKIGKVCVDCSGLISWATKISLGSAQLYDKAIKKESIISIKQAPIGALVWMSGHVGIYTGLKDGVPCYIAADGSAYGVREVPLSCDKFTHWLLMDYIEYTNNEEAKEVVEKGTIIINDKEYSVDLIRKDGVTYIKTRDLGLSDRVSISSKGKVPVINIK